MATARQVASADHTTSAPCDQDLARNGTVRVWTPTSDADHAHAAAEHAKAAATLADWAARHQVEPEEIRDLWDALAWYPRPEGRCRWCRRRRPLRGDQKLILHKHPNGADHCPGSRREPDDGSPPVNEECGTLPGYRRHVRLDEPPCPACRLALEEIPTRPSPPGERKAS